MLWSSRLLGNDDKRQSWSRLTSSWQWINTGSTWAKYYTLWIASRITRDVKSCGAGCKKVIEMIMGIAIQDVRVCHVNYCCCENLLFTSQHANSSFQEARLEKNSFLHKSDSRYASHSLWEWEWNLTHHIRYTVYWHGAIASAIPLFPETGQAFFVDISRLWLTCTQGSTAVRKAVSQSCMFVFWP